MRILRGLSLFLFFSASLWAADPVLTGRVMEASGEPIPGARVAVLEGEAEGLTDEKGLFSIVAPPGAVLRFTKEGYLPQERSVPEGGRRWDVRLRRAGLLLVRVEDAEGRKLPGARVALFEGKKPFDPGEDRTPETETETSPEGSARFEGLRPDFYTLRVTHDGFAEERAGPFPVTADGHMKRLLRLHPEVILQVRGRVTDEEGMPLEAAKVGVLERVGGEWMPKELATTDVAGRFHLAVVEPIPPRHRRVRNGREVHLFARHPDRAPALQTVIHPWEDGAVVRDFLLVPAAAVEGRVVDENEEPVPAISVRALLRWERREGGTLGIWAEQLLPGIDPESGIRTGEDGHFEVEGLPPWTISLWPRRPGWPHVEHRTQVELGPGERREGVVLEWREGLVIEGEVLDAAEGEPITGVLVERGRVRGKVFYMDTGASDSIERKVSLDRLRPGGRSTATDEEGGFRIGGFPDEDPVALYVHAESHGPAALRGIRPGGEPVIVRLERKGTLQGDLQAEDSGEPVSAFALRADPIPSRDEVWRPEVEESFVDPLGGFRLALAAGLYDVEVYAGGYVSRSLERLRVSPGVVTDLGTLILERGYEVKGIVRDLADGLPLAGAAVEVRVEPLTVDPPPDEPPEESSGNRTTLTDEEGRFHVRGLPPGEGVLRVHRPGYAEHAEGLVLQGKEKTLSREVVLGPGAEVVARFEASAGSRPGRPTFVLDPVDRHGPLAETLRRRARTVPGGEARFALIPPGRYTLREEFRLAEAKTLDLAHGDRREVVLRERGAFVEGRVLCGQEPPDHFRLEAFRSGSQASVPLQTRKTGEYRMGPSPPGRYAIFLTGSCGRNERSRATVTSIRELEIEHDEGVYTLDLELPDLRLSGRLLWADTGEAIAGGVVNLREAGLAFWPRGESATAFSDEEGAFELVVPGPGRYRVNVFGGKFERMDWELEGDPELVVPPGGLDEPLVLRLAPGRRLELVVRDAAGEPISGAGAEVIAEAAVRGSGRIPSGYSGAATDANGVAVLASPPAAASLLYVSHPQYAPHWSFGVQVPERGERREVVLRRGGFLEIVLPTPADGTDRFHVRLHRPRLPAPIVLDSSRPQGFREFARLSHEGSLVLRHLPAGTWTVESVVSGEPTRRGVVEVQEGGIHRLDLRRGQ